MQAKPFNEDILSIYIHVPFCATTCDFCAFHQDAPTRADLSVYIKALCKEIEYADLSGRVDTVFFGGGTPGLLGIIEFEQIFESLNARTDFRPDEVTVEFAPSTVKPDKAQALRALGVTRASLGVQSFDEHLLELLGRRQSAKQARQAYDILREAGFENINIDLMFAYPGQTAEQWEQDMGAAIELNPEHLSTYCLTFEEDTALWVKLTQGKLRRDIDTEADRYLQTWERLPNAGYAQYEVSNFAKPGYECLHNLNTWHMGRWRGFGPSAASQEGGWRFANPSDTQKWQKALTGVSGSLGCPPVGSVDRVQLNAETLAADAFAFGLRMNKGVSPDDVFQRWPVGDAVEVQHRALLESLVDEGYAELKKGRYCLTSEGRLRVDAIGSELVG